VGWHLLLGGFLMCGKKPPSDEDLHQYGKQVMKQARRDTDDKPLKDSWWDNLIGAAMCKDPNSRPEMDKRADDVIRRLQKQNETKSEDGGWLAVVLLPFMLACSGGKGPSDRQILKERKSGAKPKQETDPWYNPARRHDKDRHPNDWTQPRDGKFWFKQVLSSQGMHIFRYVGLVSWFKYTFIDMSHHDADCKWARFMNSLKLGRVGSVS
jgi:hypothetical protein